MLRSVRIKKFKGWQDTKKVRLAPLTLLFGANSSGKSSISHFLMMLKQTVESPDRSAVLYPGGSASAVDLGSYQDMIYRRDKKNHLDFSYEWDTAISVKDPVSQSKYSGDVLGFSARITFDDRNEVPRVERFAYELLDVECGEDVFRVGMMRNEESKKGAYSVFFEDYTLLRNKGRAWAPGAPVKFYGFPDEVVAYYQNAEFVKDLNLAHENFFNSIYYLGPMRTKVDRLYSWSGVKPASVGVRGENTIPAMLSTKDRCYNFARKQHTKSFQEIIALELKKMGLIDNFSVRQIAEGRQEYEVKVAVREGGPKVDLPDVGFGVSQVLPVLVQMFYAPAGSIIIVEQPEIHLHPAAQAALADVLIDVIRSREGSVDRNIQLIIETHSEHLLRRIQRRVAESVLSEEEVAAYFANIRDVPVTLDPLEVDEYGTIRNWPDGFFGDEVGDLSAMARAALKKRKKAQK